MPFFVESADSTTGRRSVIHSFPFRNDAPFSEDMGLRPRGFAIECYVLGAEYMAARDVLLAALETPGSGELVHPYLGTKRVQVGSVRLREAARDGGIATFAIEFDETSAEPAQPAIEIDAPAKVTASAAALKDSAGSEFVSKFDALLNLRDSVTGAVSSATDAISSILAKAAIPGRALSELTSQVESLSSGVDALLDAPSNFASSMVGMVEALGDGLLGIASAADPVAPLLLIFSSNFGIRPPDDTPARVLERANFDAVTNLVKRIVLAQTALVAIEQEFVTYDDAVQTRTAITDLIDLHAEEFSDDVFPALQDLRRDLVSAVPGVESDLPRLVAHTPRATLPVLVLAHTLYGDLDREEDLIRRNRIANPCFVAGGDELEVLSSE